MHKLGKEWILAQNGHTIGKKKSARVVVVIDDDSDCEPRSAKLSKRGCDVANAIDCS